MGRVDSERRTLKAGEYQRSNGLYEYKYVDAYGKRRSLYDSDLAVLRDKEKRVEDDISDGIVLDTEQRNITVTDLFVRYMASRKLAGTTRLNYLTMWDSLAADTIGQAKVVDLRASGVKLFYAGLDRAGYSHSTIKLIHNLLYPSLEMAVGDDIIRKNPAKKALGKLGRAAIKRTALTLQQQEKLTAFIQDSPVYNIYVPLLTIMLNTGLRCGEVLALTWSDVNMRQKEISVGKQLIYKDLGDGFRFHVVKPKTQAGIRTIPMLECVYAAFVQQKKNNFMLGLNGGHEVDGIRDFIFMAKTKRPLMPGGLNNVFYNMVAAYNKHENAAAIKEKRKPELLPKFSAHVLRHTACTRLAEAGIDIKVLQYIMGHENIAVTMDVYNHIDDKERIKHEVQKLDNAAI